jgi:hypothetical protein
MKNLNNKIQEGHTYRGYTYYPCVDTDGVEYKKIIHEVVTPEGKSVFMDWSAYSTPTEEQFALWIDLGLPRRFGLGPLDEDALKQIAQAVAAARRK